MLLGGAPLAFPVPPWHRVQFVCHATVPPSAPATSWQRAQANPVAPPLRSARWHCWHAASPRSAAKAWKPGSLSLIHDCGCATSETVPAVWRPVSWQAWQSSRVAPAGTVGCGDGIVSWQALHASVPAAHATVCAGAPSGEWQATAQVAGDVAVAGVIVPPSMLVPCGYAYAENPSCPPHGWQTAHGIPDPPCLACGSVPPQTPASALSSAIPRATLLDGALAAVSCGAFSLPQAKTRHRAIALHDRSTLQGHRDISTSAPLPTPPSFRGGS